MRKIKARRRIKQQIEETGQSYTYDTTVSGVLQWHDLLNIATFNRKLSVPKILVASHYGCRLRKRGNDGWYAWAFRRRNQSIICLNPILFACQHYFFAHVLAHEMVHQFEFEHAGDIIAPAAHGKTFLEWRPTLRRTINFPLTAKM